MEFTEPIYKNTKTKELCRIVDEIFMDVDNGLEKSIVIVGIDGIKIAMLEQKFYAEYSEYDPGEKIIKETECL